MYINMYMYIHIYIYIHAYTYIYTTTHKQAGAYRAQVDTARGILLPSNRTVQN